MIAIHLHYVPIQIRHTPIEKKKKKTGRQIPGRQKNLAAPFPPEASLVRQAAGLDMVGGQDHSLGVLPSGEDCCSHREELPLG